MRAASRSAELRGMLPLVGSALFYTLPAQFAQHLLLCYNSQLVWHLASMMHCCLKGAKSPCPQVPSLDFAAFDIQAAKLACCKQPSTQA